MSKKEDGKTGFIIGTSLLASRLFPGYRRKNIKTRYGTVAVELGSGVVFLQRHGDRLVPPHMINHRANIQALKDLGVSRIVAINSCGSLKKLFKPGSFVIPDDF
ncbi:MAG TPA: hypothetical protein VHO84_02215, partial [Syntrophorhabdaceae bacterium]|nr:hypothetical protein [Syntrophorhabdaceae bacterium]